MITTRIFIAGPINGEEQRVESNRLSDFYVIPQCVPIDDKLKYFSTAYRLDRDKDTGKPVRDNHGRVIYRYAGSKFIEERKRQYWADIPCGDMEVAQ